jgi:hypothetical protein
MEMDPKQVDEVKVKVKVEVKDEVKVKVKVKDEVKDEVKDANKNTKKLRLLIWVFLCSKLIYKRKFYNDKN